LNLVPKIVKMAECRDNDFDTESSSSCS